MSPVNRERIALPVGLLDDLDLVRRAEAYGYESAWTGERRGKTAFGKLERRAAATDRIELATGIVNVFSRTPARLAQATADALSDRFVESVGVVGTAAEVRAGIDERRDAGLGLPIVRAPMTADGTERRRTMAALAPEAV